jgi:hypothetical protein
MAGGGVASTLKACRDRSLFRVLFTILAVLGFPMCRNPKRPRTSGRQVSQRARDDRAHRCKLFQGNKDVIGGAVSLARDRPMERGFEREGVFWC